ncbi:uncharacterized protein LOC120328307 isoform X1 [Styela clava]
MSSTPPIPHDEYGRAPMNLPTYLYPGSSSLDYSSHLIPPDESNTFVSYRPKFDPVMDIQARSINSRHEAGSSGREEMESYPSSVEEKNYNRMLTEVIKTNRDMNLVNMGLDEYKRRENSTPLNSTPKNGEYDATRNLHNYVSESSLRNFTPKANDHLATGYPDMGPYSTQARLRQHAIDPRISPFSSILPNSSLLQQQMAPSFSGSYAPYDMLSSYLNPYAAFDPTREAASYAVDRRTPFPKNYHPSPGHLGLSQAAAGLQPLHQGYQDRDITRSYMNADTANAYSKMFASQYNGSPMKYNKHTSEPESYLPSRHSSHADNYPHYSNNYSQSNSLSSSSKVDQSGKYLSSGSTKDTLKLNDASVIDLTSSNSPGMNAEADVVDKIKRKKQKSEPPPLVRGPESALKENGIHVQKELDRTKEFSIHPKKDHPSMSPFGVDPRPLMSTYTPVKPSKIISGSLSDQSSQQSRLYDSPGDPKRSHTANIESPQKYNARWPLPSRYHHHTPPPHLQTPPHNDTLKNGPTSKSFKSKNVSHPGGELTFNYPEGVTTKLDRNQQALRYPPSFDNGLLRPGSHPWAKKDESKLSPWENHIMDTARDGKIPFKRNYDFSSQGNPRTIAGTIPVTNKISSTKASSHLPDYQHSAAALAEKFFQDANVESSTDVARNTVIQSTPKTEMPNNKDEEIGNSDEIQLQCNENLNVKSIEDNAIQPHRTSTDVDKTPNKIHEKISPSKPGRKRKVSNAAKDEEQKPKRKYTKRSEIWKKKGPKTQIQQIKDEVIPSPTLPTSVEESKEEKTEPRQANLDSKPQEPEPEAAPVEKRQRKSGDMDEYFYGWFTDEETENDDSSDEDYSCPTTTTCKINRGLRGQAKQRSTRRMSMRHNDSKTSEESYDFRHKNNNEKMYSSSKHEKRGRRKRRTSIKSDTPVTTEGIPVTDKTIPVTDKTILVTDKTILVTDKIIPITDNTIPITDNTIPITDKTIPITDKTNSITEKESGNDVPKVEEDISWNKTNNDEMFKKIEESFPMDQISADLDEVTGELRQITKLPNFEETKLCETKKLEKPIDIEKNVITNEIHALEPVRKKRKYTRRLDKDGLPIKRVKKIKCDIEKGTLGDVPRKKRQYRKTSDRWFKKSVNKGNEVVDSNAIGKQICPALSENYLNDSINLSQESNLDMKPPLHDLRRPSREVSQSEDIKSSPNKRKLSSTLLEQSNNTSINSTQESTISNAAKVENDNSEKLSEGLLHITTRLHDANVQNTSKSDGAKSDTPIKVKKKPGRKLGWRKYPQQQASLMKGPVLKEEFIDTDGKHTNAPVKKKYKKPKGDGLTRFGRRKRGRRPKHLLQKSPESALSKLQNVKHSTPNKMYLKHHPRKLNLTSKLEKRLGRPPLKHKRHLNNFLPTDRLRTAGDSAKDHSNIQKIFPSNDKKDIVHKISDELQSQEYEYDFTNELSLYNNGDDDDNEGGDLSLNLPENDESIATPSSPQPCQSSRPQTPTFYQNSPFPSYLKKLCCNSAIGETQLHKAARMGFVENIRYYLESGTNVNQTDNAGYTALHEACVQNNLEAAMLLLLFGADVNKNAVDGTRPLHDAVEYDHLEVARLMLACGADPMLSKFSGRAIPHMIRSQKMRNFLDAYFKELEDLTEDCEQPKELEWKFPCSTVFDKNTPHCYNTLDEPPEIEQEQYFEFELFDEPPCNTYLLQPEDESARSNFCLLDDYLKATEKQGNRKASIRITTIARDQFVSQVEGNQMQNKLFKKMVKPSLSSEVVELIALDSEVSKSTGAELVRVDIFKDISPIDKQESNGSLELKTVDESTEVSPEEVNVVLPISEKAQIERLHTIEPRNYENSAEVASVDVNEKTKDSCEVSTHESCDAGMCDSNNSEAESESHSNCTKSFEDKTKTSTDVVKTNDCGSSNHPTTAENSTPDQGS